MTEKITFEQIPTTLAQICNKIQRIEQMLENRNINSNDGEQIFNVNEASKFLNIAPITIYRKVSKNEIPFSKKSNKLYFFKSQLIEWLKNK
jgi:predicted DNA-binding transcriptional regulator AlpA